MTGTVNDSRLDRRRFGLVAIGTVGVASCTSSEKPEPVDGRILVGNLTDLNENEPINFSYANESVRDAFVIKTPSAAENGVGPDRNVVAFIGVCTHMGCPLPAGSYDAERGFFECSCHNSRFDPLQSGRQIVGRATQNLVQIELTVEDSGNIYAVGLLNGLRVGDPLTEAAIERIET